MILIEIVFKPRRARRKAQKMFQNLVELGGLDPAMSAGTTLIAIVFVVVGFVVLLPAIGSWWANRQFAWLEAAVDEDVEDVFEGVTDEQIVAAWTIGAEGEVPEEIRRAA